jgi:hypothetical protein
MPSLETDLVSPEILDGVEQGFWSAPERDGNAVYVSLYAPDERAFLARLECSSYWDEPIECLFVDSKTRAVELAAWPDGSAQFEKWIKFKSNPPFICWDQDRRGIGYHQEWKPLKQWQKNQNQILSYLIFLRRMLHLPVNGYNLKK